MTALRNIAERFAEWADSLFERFRNRIVEARALLGVDPAANPGSAPQLGTS